MTNTDACLRCLRLKTSLLRQVLSCVSKVDMKEGSLHTFAAKHPNQKVLHNRSGSKIHISGLLSYFTDPQILY